MIHLIIYVIFFAIIIALGVALFSLLKQKDSNPISTKTVKALRIRIGLSIFLFLFLFFCFSMGWIKPHGITPSSLQPINENKQE